MGEWWHYYCTVNAVVDGLFRCLVSAAMVVHNSTALLACYIQTATKTTTKAAHNYTTRERERERGTVAGYSEKERLQKQASMQAVVPAVFGTKRLYVLTLCCCWIDRENG